MNNIEKLDSFTEVEQMVSNGYTLTEAVDHIAGCYDVNAFQLGLWFADYKKGV